MRFFVQIVIVKEKKDAQLKFQTLRGTIKNIIKKKIFLYKFYSELLQNQLKSL
jgi:hypothetical protein